jgi:hypothetical protein
VILTPIPGPQDILAPASNNGSTRLLWDMLFTLITVSILGAIITGIISHGPLSHEVMIFIPTC